MTEFVPHLPLRLQPKAADHGETSVISDAAGFVIATIDSPVWDDSAQLEHPQDRHYANLLLQAANSHARMAAALDNLRNLVAQLDTADADSTWKFSEEKGAALEEANSILLELGTDEPAATSAPKINVDAITGCMLNAAVQENDLDEALRPLMAAAGIEFGDVAGVVFSGPNGECWPTATPGKRRELLAHWMKTEDAMAQDE